MDKRPNRISLRYTTNNSLPDAPILVFLHYFGGSARSWSPLIDRLGTQYRCIALDMRGFGASQLPDQRYTVDDYVDDLAALITDLKLSQVTLIGHSMGGKVALAFATRQPGALKRLILIAPSPLSPEPIPDAERVASITTHRERRDSEETLRKISARPLPTSVQQTIIEDNLLSSDVAWRAWLEHGSREDLSAGMADIRVPTLILCGEKDQTIKPEVVQREVAAKLGSAPSVRLLMLPDAAHLLPLEAPQAVADAIQAFIAPLSEVTYPAGSVRALLQTDLVTDQTRRTLNKRLQPAGQYVPKAFQTEAFRTLQAMCARLLPDATRLGVDLAANLDSRLASGESDGWRYDVLPPDREAHQGGLQGIDQTAYALYKDTFIALNTLQQDAVLRAVQGGEPPGEVWQTLPAKRYFEELLAELVAYFYSDPQALETIGYVGMADAHGWNAVGLDRLDPHEPRPNARMYQPPAVSHHDPKPTSDQDAWSSDFMRQYTPDEVVDAVIIGTGAGGAPVLARLAAAGLRVVALDAGKFWRPQTEFATDEHAQSALFWSDERLSAGEDPTAFGNNNSGIGVGGSTLHYTAYTPRAQADDLRLHTVFGVGVDWPLSHADLTPYYTELERFLGVSGPRRYPWDAERPAYPLAPLPLNGAAQLMERGCVALGIRTSPAPNAALSTRYYQSGVGWREACTNRGFCQVGCSIGAKASMDVTFIPHAIRHGAEVRAECFVTGFERDQSGRLTHVVYTKHGAEYRQACKAVFLCAGAVETPRLLLANNLANSSGQVGKNFMAHVGLQLWGQFAEDIRPYKGIPGALISEDMHRPQNADFAGGYLLQSIGVMPVTYVSQLERARLLWGSQLHDHMRGYNHTAGINVLGECLPYPGNFLELADEKDGRGLPKPRIHFSYGENESRLEAHAESLMRAIWEQAGAHEVWAFRRSAHIIGTCRMGNNPGEAVVNPDGHTFDVPNLYIADNSVFPSALSVNPALTIMAISLRTADRFLEQMKRGDA